MSLDPVLWLRAALYTTAALLACLLLRRPLRGRLGAGAAYALWGAVPLALVAGLLPGPPVEITLLKMPALVPVPVAAHPAGQGAGWQRMLLAVWLAGALLTGLSLWRGQRRFVRSLGPLRALDSTVWVATHDGGLPASLGIWRPRIVLPGDFTTRYSAGERALILAHERLHLRRGDLHANLLASALLCLGWFHPLLHLAWRAFRLDQELACDAAVLARHPGQRRRYAGAMLKCQFAGSTSPLACHWAARPALLQRLAAVHAPAPDARRARRNLRSVVALTLLVSVGGWLLQPAPVQATHGSAAAFDYRTMQAPRYPANAIAANLGGVVELQIAVSPRGAPDHIAIVHSRPAGVFDQVVLEAARHWRFQPALVDGQPVAAQIRVPVRFDPDPPEPLATDAGAGGDGRHAPASGRLAACATTGCVPQEMLQ